MRLDPRSLDDVAGMRAADPAGMLAAVATAGAQVRESVAAFDDSGLGAVLAGGGAPRAVVVAGMGGSAAAGDVLAAVAGADCRVPVLVHRGAGLPGWVGPADLVLAVSCSGSTDETLAAAAESVRRDARLITVGAAASPLARLAGEAGAPHLDVDGGGRQPRANLWSLAVPLLRAADSLGLAAAGHDPLARAADALDDAARLCGPAAGATTNVAKRIAAHLSGGLPMIWGTPGIGWALASRFACQLAENAKLPAICGALSEPHHNQIVAFDGAFGRGAGPADVGLRLLVISDDEEPGASDARVAESLRSAAQAGVPAEILRLPDDSPRVARLAALMGRLDFASVYLALAQGIDPTPVRAIDELKARLAR